MIEEVADRFASVSGEKPEEFDELRTVLAESVDGVDRISGIVDRMRRFASLSQSELGEECNASPAVYDGKFYIRGDKHLYCIGAK